MEKILYYDDLYDWDINKKKVTIYCDGNSV